jgi:hypothetical protein
MARVDAEDPPQTFRVLNPVVDEGNSVDAEREGCRTDAQREDSSHESRESQVSPNAPARLAKIVEHLLAPFINVRCGA